MSYPLHCLKTSAFVTVDPSYDNDSDTIPFFDDAVAKTEEVSNDPLETTFPFNISMDESTSPHKKKKRKDKVCPACPAECTRRRRQRYAVVFRRKIVQGHLTEETRNEKRSIRRRGRRRSARAKTVMSTGMVAALLPKSVSLWFYLHLFALLRPIP